MLLFDFEITEGVDMPRIGDTDEPFDIWEYWPFTVSVGATLEPGSSPIAWYDPPPKVEGWSKNFAEKFLSMLWQYQKDGGKIVTWNGTSFDWRLLAAITGQKDLCLELAYNSYDPCFQMLCMKGWMVSMRACAEAIGSPPKLMDGAYAPERWAEGDFDTVIDYVMQDVVVLNNIVQAAIKSKGLYTITQKGLRKFYPMPHGLLPVKKCLEYPEPNQNWMDKPITRNQVLSWR